MEIMLAKSAGFCFGVQKAVDKVYEQIDKNTPIYTLGPIIHNDEVVKDLEKKGVSVLNSLEELKNISRGIIVIRSHGVAKEVYRFIEKMGLEYVDATCPFVKKIHQTVEKESQKGREIVIVGNQGHPEVDGIKGWSSTKVTIVSSQKDAEEFTLKESDSVCIVAQTTFNYNKFQELVEIFSEKGYDTIVVNTICHATRERQTEAQGIARDVDFMIVVGDTHSSNSRKLYEICKEECDNTYFIQTLDDLNLELPDSVRLVGITAGASTPNNIIEEVQNYVRINF